MLDVPFLTHKSAHALNRLLGRAAAVGVRYERIESMSSSFEAPCVAHFRAGFKGRRIRITVLLRLAQLCASNCATEAAINAQRRKEIERARGLVEEAQAILETAQSEEQEFYDNTPENMQGGEKGERASAAADALQECVDACGDIVDKCNEAIE
jgi:hypothetical protein